MRSVAAGPSACEPVLALVLSGVMTASPVASRASPSPRITQDAESVVRTHRESRTGWASLRVDERRLRGRGRPIGFFLKEVCRYVPGEDRWRRVSWPLAGEATRLVPRAAGDTSPSRVLVSLPQEIALFR